MGLEGARGRGLARDARVARIISAQRESGGVFIREGELAGGDAIEKSDVRSRETGRVVDGEVCDDAFVVVAGEVLRG